MRSRHVPWGGAGVVGAARVLGGAWLLTSRFAIPPSDTNRPPTRRRDRSNVAGGFPRPVVNL